MKIWKAAALIFSATALFCLYQRKNAEPEPAGTLLCSAAEREAWLALRGWRVEETEQAEIRLPCTWKTEAGQRWLNIQHAQSLFPEDYAGADAVRYRFAVAGEPCLTAELILVGDVLAAASLYDPETGISRSVQG